MRKIQKQESSSSEDEEKYSSSLIEVSREWDRIKADLVYQPKAGRPGSSRSVVTLLHQIEKESMESLYDLQESKQYPSESDEDIDEGPRCSKILITSANPITKTQSLQSFRKLGQFNLNASYLSIK